MLLQHFIDALLEKTESELFDKKFLWDFSISVKKIVSKYIDKLDGNQPTSLMNSGKISSLMNGEFKRYNLYKKIRKDSANIYLKVESPNPR